MDKSINIKWSILLYLPWTFCIYEDGRIHLIRMTRLFPYFVFPVKPVNHSSASSGAAVKGSAAVIDVLQKAK